MLCCEAVEFFDLIAVTIFLEHEVVATEGVGKHNIGACFKILFGHTPYDVRVTKIKLLWTSSWFQAVVL